MKDNVLDLLIYLFENYMSADDEPRPDRNTLKTELDKAGFAEAEVTVEGKWTTQAVHQAYIEPHACVCSVGADGQVNIISSSQGQFMVRAYTAKLLAMNIANIRATPAGNSGWLA